MEEQIVTAYKAKIMRHQEDMRSKVLIEVEVPKAPSLPTEGELQAFNPSSHGNTLEINQPPQKKFLTTKITIPNPDTQVSEILGKAEKAGIFTSLKKFISRIFSK